MSKTSFFAMILSAAFATQAAGQQTYLLNDFNNNGMDVLSGGFNQQLGQFATRFYDNVDGSGSAASLLGGVDLSGLANGGSLNVRYNPLSGHATDYFAVDLYDGQSNFLSYAVDTTVPSQPGQFGFYDVAYDITAPSAGSGGCGDFDFSNVQSWAISGQPASAGPFNVNVFNIELQGDLPDPPVNYGGLDPNAPWRAEAQQRIDQVRKADLTIGVVGSGGQAIPGATVEVRQTRQAFQFGTAVAVDNLLGGGTTNQIYRDTVLELFNTVTIENGLKWDPLAGDWGSGWSLAESIQALDWAQQNGLESRGHVLIWPGSQNMPSYLDPLISAAQGGNATAKAQLLQEIEDHILEVAGATDGKVVEWDVVNEIGTNNDVLNIYGESIMDTWFAAARQADSDAKLFINEFNIISDDERSKRQSYLNSIQGLVDRGAEIGGIGLQAHFHDYSLTDLDGTGGSDPQTVWDVLDMYHDATGLPITITEYDLNTTNETVKADYLRDFLTAVFAHEGADGFIMWGFWEGRHWRPDAAMFEQDWTETPSVQVWRDLVLDEWMTDESGLSDASGEFSVRGFKGDYEIVVTVDGVEYVLEGVSLDDPTSLLVQVDVDALAGDYNGDGSVDAADYTLWRDTEGSTTNLAADGDGSGTVDAADFQIWAGNFGASAASGVSTPEPTAIALVAMTLGALPRRRDRS